MQRRPKPKPILDPLRVPTDLSAPAKRVWKQLNSVWVFEADQLLILWDALKAWDRANEAAAILKKDGLMLESQTSKGIVKQFRHPCAAIEKEARASFQAAMRLLGLSISEATAPQGRPPGR